MIRTIFSGPFFGPDRIGVPSFFGLGPISECQINKGIPEQTLKDINTFNDYAYQVPSSLAHLLPILSFTSILERERERVCSLVLCMHLSYFP